MDIWSHTEPPGLPISHDGHPWVLLCHFSGLEEGRFVGWETEQEREIKGDAINSPTVWRRTKLVRKMFPQAETQSQDRHPTAWGGHMNRNTLWRPLHVYAWGVSAVCKVRRGFRFSTMSCVWSIRKPLKNKWSILEVFENTAFSVKMAGWIDWWIDCLLDGRMNEWKDRSDGRRDVFVGWWMKLIVGPWVEGFGHEWIFWFMDWLELLGNGWMNLDDG